MVKRFTIDGLSYLLRPGRESPGLPDHHIVKLPEGKHVSLAYPETEGTVLFDMREGKGFRLHLETGEVERLGKREYFQARQACGYPVRKRKAVGVGV